MIKQWVLGEKLTSYFEETAKVCTDDITFGGDFENFLVAFVPTRGTALDRVEGKLIKAADVLLQCYNVDNEKILSTLMFD